MPEPDRTLGELADPPAREFAELSGSGVLWAVNRALFHPRGYALALCRDPDGNATGWELLGDGAEPWKYLPDADEDALFAAFEKTLHDQAQCEQDLAAWNPQGNPVATMTLDTPATDDGQADAGDD